MNNMLPSYFENMKPVQPVACNYYGIRKPKLHPPIINHEFGEQMVQYCLIKILNEDNHETTLNKNNIYSQSFFTFKVTLKINKINSYSDTCISDIVPFVKWTKRMDELLCTCISYLCPVNHA